MPTTTKHEFKISGLSCGGCVANATRALQAVEGVRNAEITLEGGRAVVETDSDFGNIEALDEAITNAGYSTDLAERLLGVEKLTHGEDVCSAKASAEPADESPKTVTQPGDEIHTLALEGMSCASCVAKIESALNKVPGVSRAEINFATHRAVVTTTDGVTDSKLIDAVKGAGYGATSVTEAADADPRDALELERARQEEEVRRWRLRFIVSAAASVFLMATLSIHSLAWGHALVATIIQLTVGAGFYAGAARALRARSTNMDTLIALGTTAAWGNGLVQLLLGGHGAHDFMTATMLLGFISLGKWLETRGRLRAGQALHALLELAPGRAHRIDGEEVRDIDARELKPGDRCRVWEGERVPADGALEDEHAEIDEAMLTGESMPVGKRAGDSIFGGTLNVGGAFSLKIEKVGAATALREIARRVEQAQNTRPEMQKLADKAASVFVPIVMAIALATLLIALAVNLGWNAALSRSIAVLIVACPCALGLAIPLSVMAGVGVAARRGMIVRTAEALEISSRIDAIVFDKTGTLTEGSPSVTALMPAPGRDEAELLAIASGVEAESTHPLAKAIRDEAKKREIKAVQFQEIESATGSGVTAKDVTGSRFVLGSDDFMKSNHIPLGEFSDEAADREAKGETVVFVGLPDDRCVGAIALADTVKEGAKASVEAIHALGLESLMLSGDAEATARSVSQSLGIKEFRARVAPGEKADEIAKLQKQGRRIAMVGDGINDAPALAQADLGIAMGGGSDIAQQSADIVLIGGDPRQIPAALSLARAIRRKMIQNLAWAFVYNIALIPLAAFGILQPIYASAAMAASSVSVVSNALLLYRNKPEDTESR